MSSGGVVLLNEPAQVAVGCEDYCGPYPPVNLAPPLTSINFQTPYDFMVKRAMELETACWIFRKIAVDALGQDEVRKRADVIVKGFEDE